MELSIFAALFLSVAMLTNCTEQKEIKYVYDPKGILIFLDDDETDVILGGISSSVIAALYQGVGPIIVSGVNLTAYAATTKYANTRLAPNTTLINILLSGDSQASAYAASTSNIVSGGSPNNPNLTGSVTYRI